MRESSVAHFRNLKSGDWGIYISGSNLKICFFLFSDRDDSSHSQSRNYHLVHQTLQSVRFVPFIFEKLINLSYVARILFWNHFKSIYPSGSTSNAFESRAPASEKNKKFPFAEMVISIQFQLFDFLLSFFCVFSLALCIFITFNQLYHPLMQININL